MAKNWSRWNIFTGPAAVQPKAPEVDRDCDKEEKKHKNNNNKSNLSCFILIGLLLS